MRRFVWLICLPLVALAAGCSNRPLAGLMDCLLPSRGGRPPANLPRPTDSDPLPPVPGFDPAPPADDGFRRDPLFPRGDRPPPLGSPIAPDGRRPTESEVPFQPRPGGGAMPLPSGGGT
jgi:hypothetical protein